LKRVKKVQEEWMFKKMSVLRTNVGMVKDK